MDKILMFSLICAWLIIFTLQLKARNLENRVDELEKKHKEEK